MMLGQEYKALYDGYYTDALDRKRELTARCTLEHIRSLVGDRRFGSVVDVGAGQGSLIGLLHNENFADKITGLEISSSGLEKINARRLSNVTALSFDGYRIDFPNKSFDLSLSIHVLEHVEHERLYLKELGRISRQAIIEVPLELNKNTSKAISIGKAFGHINFYQRETFKNILESSGFTVRGMLVRTVSRELDMFMSGKVKGSLKNAIRSTALRLDEGVACRNFVYLCTAYVDCP